MVCAQCRKERLGSDREQLQLLVAQRERKNGHINREVAQSFYQDRSGFFNDAQLRVGVSAWRNRPRNSVSDRVRQLE